VNVFHSEFRVHQHANVEAVKIVNIKHKMNKAICKIYLTINYKMKKIVLQNIKDKKMKKQNFSKVRIHTMLNNFT
jgi:hypothetical protein